MIGKLILWFYLIFVVPVIVVVLAGLIWGGIQEGKKYYEKSHTEQSRHSQDTGNTR